MKYSAVIAVFLGYAKADAPPAFNEPPFAVKTHPSAAGLVQVESACAQFGVAGVTCDPANNMLFATGMNGDEDLGEDITMKGQKFHFIQKPQALFATGMNGDEDLGEDITMKGQKFHFNQAPASQQLFAVGMNGDEDLGEYITMKGQKFHFIQKPQALFATGMNGDEDLGEDITMKGQKFHFNQQPQPIGALMQMQGDGEAAAIHKADWTGYTFPDKVHTLDPKIAKTHTAFYAQRD